MNTTHVTVVGGSYCEVCAFPPRTLYRGSGGRAAAILSSLGAEVTLNTATGPRWAVTFKDIAKRFGYRLANRATELDVWFHYSHPLAPPSILPECRDRGSCEETVDADLALVFGMIEGRPRINARRVVYDPQDGELAQPFSADGSSASELAIVLSYSEAKVLSGEAGPSAMADKLLSEKNVTVVVIKCGPLGALVKTREETSWVRPFATQYVYKIGSGDAFSAGFSYAWMLCDKDPVSAAWLGSRLAAAYVESTLDRFTTDDLKRFEAEIEEARNAAVSAKIREVPSAQIYLAGPFFTTAQQWLINEVRDTFTDMGLKVFSPVHEVGFGEANEVAVEDLKHLEQSGLVFALLDGLDPGTVFEVGYARAKGIPVIGIAEAVEENDLTMAIGTNCDIRRDLATGIYAAYWRLADDE